MNKILVYGEMLWDVFPDIAVPGGATMNAAMGLRKLGADVVFMSGCGNDKYGDDLLAYLKENGMSSQWIQRNEYPTGVVNIKLSEKHDASYEIVFPSAWDYIKKPELLPEFDVLVYGSLSCRNQTSYNSLLCLLETNSLKVFDVNFRAPFIDQHIVEQLLVKADIVKLNHEELLQIARWEGIDSTDLETLADFVIQQYQIQLLCVTIGIDGAFLQQGALKIYQPSYEVVTADTVGAGDAFLAGFIYHYIQNKPLKEALEFACRLGAYVASKKGANPVFISTEIQGLKEAHQSFKNNQHD
ncbi:MAG: carbohydrate kinase [Saprospiraceae bacterium]|jgi:fructokinase|nr:carbohydrate kinase [Saprospiraceae bacterium]MDP4913178.1 carbohydrate kinase [Saprospiraceae bacterium]